MRLDLNKLDHLIAVAEEGSVTRAAARLHLSQQALSTSIRVLEREVGVPLLERGTAGVTVLPAGAALIEDARVLNGMARAALRRARQTGRGETLTLRIGHTPAVTGDELVTLLAPVTDAHPDVTPEIHQRYPFELTAALLMRRPRYRPVPWNGTRPRPDPHHPRPPAPAHRRRLRPPAGRPHLRGAARTRAGVLPGLG